jgi:hypothetical protein
MRPCLWMYVWQSISSVIPTCVIECIISTTAHAVPNTMITIAHTPAKAFTTSFIFHPFLEVYSCHKHAHGPVSKDSSRDAGALT